MKLCSLIDLNITTYLFQLAVYYRYVILILIVKMEVMKCNALRIVRKKYQVSMLVYACGHAA